MVGDLPIVTRERLDAIAAHVEELRGRLEVARNLVSRGKEVASILDRLATAGPDLSREEFVGISAFQAVMQAAFMGSYLDVLRVLRDRPGMHPAGAAALALAGSPVARVPGHLRS